MGFFEDIGKVPTDFLESMFNRGYLLYAAIIVLIVILYIFIAKV